MLLPSSPRLASFRTWAQEDEHVMSSITYNRHDGHDGDGVHQFAEPLAILLVQLVQATRYSCISAKEVDEYNDGNYDS